MIYPRQAQLLLLHQICFDLYENASQQFLREVRQTLPRAPAGSAAAALSAPAAAAGDETMAVDGGAAAAAADGSASLLLPPPEVLTEAARIDSILSGEVTTRLHLEFLFRNNKTDLSILRTTKTATEGKVSALHSAVVFANAIMHAGTSVDVFLRENLDWLGRASNWAKFSAVATLGVIHKARTAALLYHRALRVLTKPRCAPSINDETPTRATCRRGTRCWRRTCRSRAPRARPTRKVARSLRSASSTPTTAAR